MTKGNWERRAEMAAKRKAENKALKEAKAAGTLAATPEAVMQSLLTLDPDAEVWLNAAPEAPEPIRGTNHAPSRGPGSVGCDEVCAAYLMVELLEASTERVLRPAGARCRTSTAPSLRCAGAPSTGR